MKAIQLVKPGLFIFECIRVLTLALILISKRNEPEFFTRILFAAPCTLFLLMALFIWLDTSRYREYLPLFAAGKCIGIFILLLWSIISKQVTIIYNFGFILSGDIFTLAIILLINKDSRKPAETEIITDVSAPEAEDN